MGTLRLILLALCSHGPAVDALYGKPPCGENEVSSEVQGVKGLFCSPKCLNNSFDCPVPRGAQASSSARPTCMLQGLGQGAFCALLCHDDGCPDEAVCKPLEDMQVGVCVYRQDFHDWVTRPSSQRLRFGLPTHMASAFAAKKGNDAVQNMRLRYGIAEDDADLRAIQGALSSMAAPTSADVLGNAASVIASFADMNRVIARFAKLEHLFQRDRGLGLRAWEDDLDYFMRTPTRRVLTDTLHDVAHLEEPGSASHILRSLVQLFLAYALLGVLYKSQVMGERGVSMIPHIGFWMDYPSLVVDGIAYSRQVLFGDTDTGGGSSVYGGFAAITSAGDGRKPTVPDAFIL